MNAEAGVPPDLGVLSGRGHRDELVDLAGLFGGVFASGPRSAWWSALPSRSVVRLLDAVPALVAIHPECIGRWRLGQFSRQVASVGALGALGVYYVPKADVTTYALPSRGVTTGSMRSYGTLQTHDGA